MQFKGTNVEQSFIKQAILGARLSYGNGKNSDSMLKMFELHIGPEDERFLKARLNASAQGENKFLRVIPVSVFITAPLKWWVELDTYKVGTVRQSSSLMHRLASKGRFAPDDFDVLDSADPSFLAILDTLNAEYDKWIASGARRHDKYPEWTAWQDLIPRSFLYESHWIANYAVLRNIYFQRKDHRMVHWKKFLEWIENNLPHSWLITYQKEQ